MLRTAARNFSITISALDLVLCTLESPTVRASDQSTKIKVQSTAYSFDYGYCSTGLFNLLTRALRETVRRNLERLGNFAISQHHDIVVLGNGEVSKALKISAHRFTKSAREKIEKAGGAVTVIE